MILTIQYNTIQYNTIQYNSWKNVSFKDTNGKDASIEMNSYGSYAMNYKQADYKVGYQYPSATAANFEEVYVGVSLQGL